MDRKGERDMIYNSCLTPATATYFVITVIIGGVFSTPSCAHQKEQAGGILADDFQALRHTNNLTFSC